jgi:parallel beta-helix repeat protein
MKGIAIVIGTAVFAIMAFIGVLLLAVPAAAYALGAPKAPAALIAHIHQEGYSTTINFEGQGLTVTLSDLRQAIQIVTTTKYLTDEGNGVWFTNANLTVYGGLTLTLTSDTVTWLKLYSHRPVSNTGTLTTPVIDYTSFVYLRALSGTLLISGTRITSWDPVSNTYDLDPSHGRAYVLARYAARMNIINSDLSYLGSADSVSYGVSWKDGSNPGATSETRATGNVISSTFSYNYYGIYTFQAANMVFRGNKFHNNIGYGFDPHDLTHDVLVEDNESYNNGNHGFIISRGCYNFVFRHNKSYNNVDTANLGKYGTGGNAHGFMIDLGSPSAFEQNGYPQIPSHDNLLEDNQAWGNKGDGLSIRGGYSNIVNHNVFTSNHEGIAVYGVNSYSNTIFANTIFSNTFYGIQILSDTHNNTFTQNIISSNGSQGVYIVSGQYNLVSQNTITGNKNFGILATQSLSPTTFNQWSQNQIYNNGLGCVLVQSGANNGITVPQNISLQQGMITGLTVPDAHVELYSDSGGQCRNYLGTAIADSTGTFSWTITTRNTFISAIATDSNGNSSGQSKTIHIIGVYVPIALR